MRRRHNKMRGWRKSSYSADGDSNCVEVQLRWRKATYSGTGDSNCVEVIAWPRVSP
ncbi:DUF397 domain-containing protein [Actinoallomurus sp. NPDC052308]|uniref:DUF397 domain-containing protein n=1 Tax=Actinoallomurus sp. NPDC052308 TaxID=3155530 RepID=UPI00342ED955